MEANKMTKKLRHIIADAVGIIAIFAMLYIALLVTP
jgi:hypothetical protein